MAEQSNDQKMVEIDLSTVDDKLEVLAVDVQNAFYEYQKDVTILDDLCLQIPKGKIFALLGPNGTGKTTLIRNILGRLQLNSGSIKVFGETPGSRYSDIPGTGVGYMPQDLALFEDFTINEILKYYGTIYHINGQQLNKRVDNLIDILNLPEKDRPINKLSGGQKRRVSIAVTIIHSPRLIILDEPTVGVDSLLRDRIWRYLEDMCQQNNQTVLITTHYIEEAKSAANVAFMSYGTILVQSNPQKLLQQYGCQTLESVFLILCEQTKIRRKSLKLSEILEQTKINLTSDQLLDQKLADNNGKALRIKQTVIDGQRVRAMLWKYYTMTVRKPVFLYLFYLIPLLALSTVRLALGQFPKNIPMVVYNNDQTPTFSQIIIDSIDKEYIDLRIYDSNQTAFESVVNGTNYMSVVFGQNFSDTFEYRVKDVFEISDEELESSKIKVYVDFSNAAMGIFVLKYLLRAFNKFLNIMGPQFGYNAERYFHLVSVEEPIYGEFEFNLAEVFGPGILLALAQVLPLIISALQIVFDRKNSNLERILVAGVKPIEIFLAHLIENLVLIATQLIFILFIAFFIFKNTQIGSYLDVYLLLLLIGIQGMTFGFFIALVVKDEVGILAGILLTILPLWIVSGIFWPIEAIPISFRFLVKLGPLTLPLQALRAIMLRGWTYTHPAVMLGFVANIVYICILTFLDIILFTKLTK